MMAKPRVRTSCVGGSGEDDIEKDEDLENGPDLIKKIKEKFTSLVQGCGGSWTSEAKFPWKDMPQRLATCGVVVENWPEGVPLPGTEKTAARKSKGISALTHQQQKVFLAALKGSSNPIRAVKGNTSGELTLF
jgi:hypothetical protein